MAHVTYDQSTKQVTSDSCNNVDQASRETVKERHVFDVNDLEVGSGSRTVFSEENPEKQHE